MLERIKGLIGVDTYNNIEYPLSQKGLDKMIKPLRNDFRSGARDFVRGMFTSDSDAQLRAWILDDMSAAAASVALSALEEYMSGYIIGYNAEMFDEVQIPIMSVNADLWPIDYEANRRHMSSFDAIVLKAADHFLMVNCPNEFNKALKQAIKGIMENEEKE